MSESERYLTRSAVMLFLLREREGKREILLQKRQNTGYADGRWDCGCSGHVDEGESMKQAMAREAAEELGISIALPDLEFACMVHKHTPETGIVYYNGFFAARRYEGTPEIREPEKCAGLRWFDVKALPESFLPDRKLALDCYFAGVPYTETGWPYQEAGK